MTSKVENVSLKRLSALGLVLIASAVIATGCGMIADKDRIIIATLDGNNITRGDFAKILRDMTDEDRPLIQNKNDFLNALNDYIDDEVKAGLATKLHAEKKISVPREVSRAAYFEAFPDYRTIYEARNSNESLAEDLGITEGDLVAVRAEIEFGIDDIEEKLLREEAVRYTVNAAVREGSLTINDEEFQREFESVGTDIRRLETIEFQAILIPEMQPEALREAGDIRRRLTSGEPFESIAEKYRSQNPRYILESVLQNDPTSTKFRAIWEAVSSRGEGDIVGPTFLPSFEQVSEGPTGRTQSRALPDSYIVMKILNHMPESEMTWEEARPDLTPGLRVRKTLDRLREEHGVQVFEKNLPDPSGFGDQYKDDMIETK